MINVGSAMMFSGERIGRVTAALGRKGSLTERERVHQGRIAGA